MVRMENFEEFLKGITPEIFSKTLEKADAQREVKNPKLDIDKMDSYCQAISKLNDFLKDGRGKANFDDPNHSYDHHTVTIHLYNDEFDASEIKQFTEILNLFDGMMTIGDSNGNVSFVLLMENIYVEKSQD